MSIPGGTAFLLGLTNEWHSLIWKDFNLPSYTSTAPLQIQYGPGFWFFTAIAYILILAGFVVYTVTHLKSDRSMRIKTGVVLAGAALTVFTNLLFLALNNDLQIDPTPLSFGLSAPLIAFGFFRYGVMRLFPLAATLVLENLKDGIVIVNRKDVITDINAVGKRLLGVTRLTENLLVFSTLPQADKLQEIWDKPNARIILEFKVENQVRLFETQVIPILSNKQNPIGRIIIFHDATREQNLLRAEKRRSQQLSLLEETGRRIADSFEEREILQRAVDAITQVFGYPETAISILNKEKKLEIAVISGTVDFGYRPGFVQELGSGIIGYTANLQKTYISNNVSEDHHYFSTSTKSGSAICVPIFKQNALYGVLYVESFELNAFDELDVSTLETVASQISESLQRASLYAQTQKDLRTITIIQNISKLVASSLDLETISRIAVENIKTALGYTHVSIFILEEDYLHLSAQFGYPNELHIKKIHISQGVAGRAIRTKAVQFIEDASKEDIFLKADPHIVSEVCIPLLKEDTVLGILNVESTQPNHLKSSDVELLTAIAGPIAVGVDNARLHAELKRMATTDAVTGLANRHVFEQALEQEISRAEREGSFLSLIIFDIDYFKQFNDQWGHPAGDTRLKAVANILKLNLRKHDIAARYGGDEFAIILTNCNGPDAMLFAERLRQSTQAGAPDPIPEGDGLPGYTLSMGIATYPIDATQPNDLLITADNAALRAKQQGRNRIKFANDYETT